MPRWILAVFLLAGTAGATSANERMLGVWEGSYTCNSQGKSLMTLTIDSLEGSAVAGIFEFRVGSKRGVFQIGGTVTPDGSFHLKPGKWLKRPSNFVSLGMKGQIDEGGRTISGIFTELCRGGGSFAASHAAALPEAVPGEAVPREAEPGEAEPGEAAPDEPAEIPPAAVEAPPAVEPVPAQSEEEWAASIRARTEQLLAARNENADAWSSLEEEVQSSNRPESVGKATAETLAEEVRRAKNSFAVERLLRQLAAENALMSEGGLLRVIHLLHRANAAGWDAADVEKVMAAGRAKVADIMRPDLERAALLAAQDPVSIDAVASIREILAWVVDYGRALEQYLGTADIEGRLSPLYRRMEEIETDPAFIENLKLAFAQARLENDPRYATENLIARLFGHYPPDRLAGVIAEARDLADVAAIVVEDQSGTGADSLEPSVWHIAAFAHGRARDISKEVAAKEASCRAIAQGSDPIAAIACLPWLSTGEIAGGLRVRVTRVVKHGCVEEVAGTRYLCRFLQDIAMTSASGGYMAPDLADQMVPGGYQGEETKATFHRIGEGENAGWQVSWDFTPSAPASSQGSVSCSYGSYDAGGFCFPFNAFGK